MKILDDITNEVIEGKIAVKVSFHCYDLDRHCLTIEGKEEPNNFQAKTLFVSKHTARLMSIVTEDYIKNKAKQELVDLDEVVTALSEEGVDV